MEIEGIQVRQFVLDEWQSYRSVRLQALESDPRFFSATFEEAKNLPDEKWQQDLADPDCAVFGVFRYEDVIGMTGIALDRDDPEKQTATLWGSWLDPQWRAKGLSRKMYEARLDWARARPSVKRVTVSHRKSNAVSKRANQRWGFKFTHAKEAVWPGGQKETEFFYELVIQS